MINGGRTNIVPGSLIIACAVLMIVRCAVICYRTYFPAVSPRLSIVWQAPAELQPQRRDLLSRPTLYFFCDHSHPVASAISDLVAGVIFNNRQIVQYMQNNFRLIKVDSTSHNSDLIAQLSRKYHYYSLFKVVVTLVDGTKIDSCDFDSDRGFMIFLQNAYSERRFETAAQTAMLDCDFKEASDAYEKIDPKRRFARAPDGYEIYWCIALLRQHRDDEAKQILEKSLASYRTHNSDDAYPIPQIRYLLGQLSQQQLIDRGKIPANYLIGEQLMLQGKTKQAAEKFRLAGAKNQSYWLPCRLARAELLSLGQELPKDTDEDKETSTTMDDYDY